MGWTKNFALASKLIRINFLLLIYSKVKRLRHPKRWDKTSEWVRWQMTTNELLRRCGLFLDQISVVFNFTVALYHTFPPSIIEEMLEMRDKLMIWDFSSVWDYEVSNDIQTKQGITSIRHFHRKPESRMRTTYSLPLRMRWGLNLNQFCLLALSNLTY